MSQLSPSDWVKEIKSNHSQALGNCGGFTLLVASINPSNLEVETKFLSNCDQNIESLGPNISMALSNGMYGDKTWTKIDYAEQEFQKIPDNSSVDDVLSDGFRILSTPHSPPPCTREELRKSVFIPPICISKERGLYGTRSETAIVFDGPNVTYAERDIANGGIEKIERFQVKN